MRIVMVCCVSLFATLTGCAFEEPEDELVSDSAEVGGVADPEAAPLDEELAAAEAEGVVEPGDELVADEEAAVAQGEAGAEAKPTNVPESELAPCGLSITASGDGKVWYQIRNCHSYRVHRELDIAGWWDICPCHNLAPGETESGSCARPASSVRGIRSC